MKIAVIAVASALALAACAGTEAEAAEIGNTGISIGAELDPPILPRLYYASRSVR